MVGKMMNPRSSDSDATKIPSPEVADDGNSLKKASKKVKQKSAEAESNASAQQASNGAAVSAEETREDEGGAFEPNDYLKALNKRLRPWKKKTDRGLELVQRQKNGEVLNDDQIALLKDIERNKLLVDELQKVRDELMKIQKEKESTDASSFEKAASQDDEPADKKSDELSAAPAGRDLNKPPPCKPDAVIEQTAIQPVDGLVQLEHKEIAAVLQLYQVFYFYDTSREGGDRNRRLFLDSQTYFRERLDATLVRWHRESHSVYEDSDFDEIDTICRICCGLLQNQDGTLIPIYERVKHCRKFLESSEEIFMEGYKGVTYKLLKDQVDEIVSKAFSNPLPAEHAMPPISAPHNVVYSMGTIDSPMIDAPPLSNINAPAEHFPPEMQPVMPTPGDSNSLYAPGTSQVALPQADFVFGDFSPEHDVPAPEHASASQPVATGNDVHLTNDSAAAADMTEALQNSEEKDGDAADAGTSKGKGKGGGRGRGAVKGGSRSAGDGKGRGGSKSEGRGGKARHSNGEADTATTVTGKGSKGRSGDKQTRSGDKPSRPARNPPH